MKKARQTRVFSLLTAERHHAMMNHVERRDMLIFLSQDEEQSIEELGEFGDVIPPTGLRHPKSFWRVIHRLTPVAVVSQPSALQILDNKGESISLRYLTLIFWTHEQRSGISKSRVKVQSLLTS
jgi:hypothetical protein